MTDKQKEQIASLESYLVAMQIETTQTEKRIAEIKATCTHEITKDRKYKDYDRNCYEVICLDCDETIFEGNYWQFRTFKGLPDLGELI